MTDLVEQLARAIAAARAGEENAALSEFQAGNLWWESKRDARAALKALRPTIEAWRVATYAEFADEFDAITSAPQPPALKE